MPGAGSLVPLGYPCSAGTQITGDTTPHHRGVGEGNGVKADPEARYRCCGDAGMGWVSVCISLSVRLCFLSVSVHQLREMLSGSQTPHLIVMVPKRTFRHMGQELFFASHGAKQPGWYRWLQGSTCGEMRARLLRSLLES